jgi:hypothetical protein
VKERQKKKIFTLKVFEMMPHGTLINKPTTTAKSLAYISLFLLPPSTTTTIALPQETNPKSYCLKVFAIIVIVSRIQCSVPIHSLALFAWK